eukprot:s575_g19.t1
MMYLPRLEQGQRENIFAWANSFQAAFQFAKAPGSSDDRRGRCVHVSENSWLDSAWASVDGSVHLSRQWSLQVDCTSPREVQDDEPRRSSPEAVGTDLSSRPTENEKLTVLRF